MSLTDTDAANYVLATPAITDSVNIARKVVGLSATRVYDGTVDLTGSDVTISTGVGSETLTYTGATANSAHVASATHISAITLDDGSGLASNYALPTLDASNAAATISAKTITADLTNTGVTKVYDASTRAPTGITPSFEVAGGISGDSFTLSYSDADYDSAGTDATSVTVSGISLSVVSGTGQVTDYNLTTTSDSVAATITPAALTVTANNDARFVAQTDSSGFNGVSYSGFVGGETASVLTGTASVTRTNASNNTAGVFSGVLRPAGLSSSNYDITFVDGDYTIVPADQLLVLADNLTETYATGGDYSVSKVSYFDSSTNTEYRLDDNSIAGSSVSQSGNTFSVNDGRGATAQFDLIPQGGSTSGAGHLDVGSYQIAPSNTVTVTGTNFSNTITVTGAHQVNTLGISANASGGVAKVFDATAAMSGLSVTLTGLETDDVVTAGGVGAFAQSNVGTSLNYTVNNLTLSGADSGNYHLTGGDSFSGSNGAITARTVNVTANAQSKVYGQSDPTLSYQVANADATTGLVDATSFTGGLTRANGQNVGSYAIGQGNLALNSNYSINYTGADLTITPAALTLTARDNTKVYGDVLTLGSSAFDATGLQYSDAIDAATLTSPGALATANAGTYSIVPSSASGTAFDSSNYDITYVSGDLSVTQRAVTLTADDRSRTYGDSLSLGSSAFTRTSGTLASGDAITGVTLTSTGGHDARVTDGVGTHVGDLVASSAVGTGQFNTSNYAITYLPGDLSITARPLTITARDQSTTYGNALSLGTVAYDTAGLANNDQVTSVELEYLGSAVVPGTVLAGDYSADIVAANAAGSGLSNYAITYVPADLTVERRGLTITATDRSTTYGDALALGTSGFSTDGLVNSDTVAAVTLQYAGSSTVAATQNAGVYADGVVPSAATGSGLSNYDLSYVPADLTIDRRQVSLSASRDYDGTVDLTGDVTLGNLANGESLTYSGAVASDKHVATADKYISEIGLADGTGLASNYVLPPLNRANAPATIQPRTLTASITNSGISRVYDGTTAAPADYQATYSVTGFAAGDSAAELSYANAAYNGADVAAATTLTLTGVDIDGVTGNLGSHTTDYQLANTTLTRAASITPRSLTVTANDDAIFVAGDTPDANFEGVTYDGFVVGEDHNDLAGTLAVTRIGTDTVAGVYNNVLQPSGLTSSNYDITFENGDFTIVGADQLLVEVDSLTTAYGGAIQYALGRVAYYDGNNVVELGSGMGSKTIDASNQVAIRDGSGGTVDFRLRAQDGSYSGANLLEVDTYVLEAANYQAENGLNFSNTMVVVGNHRVDPKTLSASVTGGITKEYDGNLQLNGIAMELDSVEAGDTVSVAGIAALATKNAGTAKAFGVNGLALSGSDAANYQLSASSLDGSNAVVTRRSLDLTVAGVDRDYDGSTDARVTISDDRVTGDTFTVNRSASFADKNVGANKAVSVSGIALTGGDAQNYSVSVTASTTASISQLNSVTWTGGAGNDNWFDPANWTDGAVPDLSNVANVVIPTGTTPIFGMTPVAPALSGAVNLATLNGGNLNQIGGVLNVTTMSLEQLTQTAGQLTLGTFTVSNDFTQSGGGAIRVSGNAQITDRQGGLAVGNLTVSGQTALTSTAGSIIQSTGTQVDLQDATIAAEQGSGAADVTLDVANNQLDGVINVNGRAVSLYDAAGTLTLGNIDAQTLEVTAVGDITQSDGSRLNVQGNTRLAAGGAVNLPSRGNQLRGLLNVTGSRVLVGGSQVAQQAQRAAMAVMQQTSQLTAGARVIQMPVRALALSANAARSLAPGATASPSRPTGSTGSTGSMGGIVVDTLVQPSQEASGLVVVQVPPETAISGTGFTFSMPTEVVAAAAENTPQITTASGDPLPTWLEFDANNLEFRAAAVPDGGLPLTLRVNVGGQQITIVVSEQADQIASNF